jgi:hypothetical protein
MTPLERSWRPRVIEEKLAVSLGLSWRVFVPDFPDFPVFGTIPLMGMSKRRKAS